MWGLVLFSCEVWAKRKAKGEGGKKKIKRRKSFSKRQNNGQWDSHKLWNLISVGFVCLFVFIFLVCI